LYLVEVSYRLDTSNPMTKIIFIDPLGWDYTPQTPREMPLGGSQSALCYLSEALASRGVNVTLITGTSAPGLVRGVICVNGAQRPWEHIAGADLVVVLNECPPEMAVKLRANLPVDARLILWTQHAHDEPAIAALRDAAIRDVWDHFVFVSEWQRDEFVRTFGIRPVRCTVLRNAVAPTFEHMFAPGQRVMDAKPWPPTLAYTSTPFRGLDVLLDSFPTIRSAVPEVRLQVFSSLTPYRVAASADPYRPLYRRCAETEGVDYVGAVSQADLADRLRGVTALAYLNRFAETSCISVMEALSAGCLVVSSRLGALPETGMGFAHLMPVPSDPAQHAAQYAQFMIGVLGDYRREETTERRLRAQVDHVNAATTWAARADAWIAWFQDLQGGLAVPSTMAIGRALQARNPDRAAALCRRAIVAAPQDGVAWRQLAEADIARARWTAATRHLARAACFSGRVAVPSELIDGLARNLSSDPLDDRLAATAALARFAPSAASALASRCEDIAPEAKDFAASPAARRPTIESPPEDALQWVSLAWAETQCGRHAESLALLNAMVSALGAKALAGDQARAAARRCIEAAEQALLVNATPPYAAAMLRQVAALCEALGEAGRELRSTADQMDLLDADDTTNVALLIVFALGRRRLAQGRPADALPLLKTAADWGAGVAVTTSLLHASIAQAQRVLLDAIHRLMDAGRQGKGPPGWRRSSAEMIAHVDQSLLLEHNGEDNRSKAWGTVRGFDAWLRFSEVSNSPTPATPERRIIDCFQFYNELDLLEVRLAELAPVVDRFVLVEARYTHAGDPKPLYFDQNRHRFAAYLDRIDHVIVEDDPGGFSWKREGHQREAIARGIPDLADDDMILVSDVDEIPRRGVIAALREMPADLYSLQLAIHLYFLDLKSPEPWIAAAAAPGRLIRRIGVNPIRYLVKQGIGHTIEDAGWHLTWMGGLDGFRAKMRAYAHRENSAGFEAVGDSEARLKRFYATGVFDAGLVPGMWSDLNRVAIDEDFPVGIREQVDQFRARGWLCP
jgi:glycosyltransferase involved in cell wall biosynthesis